jgi:hypothetical protein
MIDGRSCNLQLTGAADLFYRHRVSYSKSANLTLSIVGILRATGVSIAKYDGPMGFRHNGTLLSCG